MDAVPGPLDAEARRHLLPVDRQEIHPRHGLLAPEIHREPLPGRLAIPDAPARPRVPVDEMPRLVRPVARVTVHPVGGIGVNPIGRVGRASTTTKPPTGGLLQPEGQAAQAGPELRETVRGGHDRRRRLGVHGVGVLHHGFGPEVGRDHAHAGQVRELEGRDARRPAQYTCRMPRAVSHSVSGRTIASRRAPTAGVARGRARA